MVGLRLNDWPMTVTRSILALPFPLPVDPSCQIGCLLPANCHGDLHWGLSRV